MAIFDVDFSEDFLKDLLNTDSEEICMQALEEAAPIMENAMKDTLRQDNHEISGELIESIKATRPKKSTNGAYIVNVRPTGYSTVNAYSVKRGNGKVRRYKVSNALKMIWIEYGVNGRQPARPFLTRTVNSVKVATLKRMQEVYNRMAGAG